MNTTIIPVVYEGKISHGFLNGKEFCKYCDYCDYDSRIERARCRITGEILPYYDTSMGCKCPLVRKNV